MGDDKDIDAEVAYLVFSLGLFGTAFIILFYVDGDIGVIGAALLFWMLFGFIAWLPHTAEDREITWIGMLLTLPSTLVIAVIWMAWQVLKFLYKISYREVDTGGDGAESQT